MATQTPAPDIAKLIADGYDPVHAAYIFVDHITSVFSENVSRFPEMRTNTQGGRQRRGRIHALGTADEPAYDKLLHLLGFLRPPNREDDWTRSRGASSKRTIRSA